MEVVKTIKVKCPECGGESISNGSRKLYGGRVVRRYRHCKKCGKKFIEDQKVS